MIYVVSKLDDIGWCLNLRGSDIAFNPVFFSYLLISQHQVILFTQQHQHPSLQHYATQHSFTLQPYSSFYSYLNTIQNKYIYASDKHCNAKIFDLLRNNKNRITTGVSILEHLKCVKNSTELKGLSECHRRDGVALCIAYSYLQQQLSINNKITEHEFALYLDN